jgi:hypothetical protein
MARALRRQSPSPLQSGRQGCYLGFLSARKVQSFGPPIGPSTLRCRGSVTNRTITRRDRPLLFPFTGVLLPSCPSSPPPSLLISELQTSSHHVQGSRLSVSAHFTLQTTWMHRTDSPRAQRLLWRYDMSCTADLRPMHMQPQLGLLRAVFGRGCAIEAPAHFLPNPHTTAQRSPAIHRPN